MKSEKQPEKKKPEICGNCKFMSPAEICHRYPKQVIAPGAFGSNSAQPKVNKLADWCGEYKEREK